MHSSRSNNQRGILAICGCMASYTVNDVLVKQILHSYPIGEVIFVRGAMSVLLIGAAVLVVGYRLWPRAAIKGRLVWRSAFDGLSTAGFVAALANMQIANVAAVLQVAPLIITALSVMLYREAVGWQRWTAIGIGFAGALLVIKPLPWAFNVWALAGVASALFAALREIQTRRIGQELPTLVVAFWGAVGITLFGPVFAVGETWNVLPAADLVQLMIAAVFVGIAIYLMAAAFREVDLSVVAPFRYSYLLTSALGGFLVFDEIPDGWSVIGAALIVGSGIYALHREAAHRRALTAKASVAL